MDLQEIKSIIKEARPNISENSLNIYSMNVKKVLGNNEIKILKNKQHILDFLQGKSASTKRNYLNAILIFLKINESKTNKKKLINPLLGCNRPYLRQAMHMHKT
jgi:hypothetical protein